MITRPLFFNKFLTYYICKLTRFLLPLKCRKLLTKITIIIMKKFLSILAISLAFLSTSCASDDFTPEIDSTSEMYHIKFSSTGGITYGETNGSDEFDVRYATNENTDEYDEILDNQDADCFLTVNSKTNFEVFTKNDIILIVTAINGNIPNLDIIKRNARKKEYIEGYEAFGPEYGENKTNVDTLKVKVSQGGELKYYDDTTQSWLTFD